MPLSGADQCIYYLEAQGWVMHHNCPNWATPIGGAFTNTNTGQTIYCCVCATQGAYAPSNLGVRSFVEVLDDVFFLQLCSQVQFDEEKPNNGTEKMNGHSSEMMFLRNKTLDEPKIIEGGEIRYETPTSEGSEEGENSTKKISKFFAVAEKEQLNKAEEKEMKEEDD